LIPIALILIVIGPAFALDPIKVARTDVSILIVALLFIDNSLIDGVCSRRQWLLEKVVDRFLKFWF
jgi:hypothetical protein